MRRHPPRCLAGFPWNHWPGSRGIRGRNQMESPAGITWNPWPGSSGICKYGEFRIGSGLSDAERSHPPPVGTVITYRYRGFTAKGLPRFPTYVRVRSEP